MVTISTIIPCYNCEDHIEETVRSVLNQTLQELEIICVNNNSTDSTAKVLATLANADNRIKVCSEPQAGANYARNTGLALATGELIQFLDADDVITANKFEVQCREMRAAQLDLIISDREVYDENLETVLEFIDFKGILADPLAVAISKIIITGNPIYRTDFVRRIGGYLKELTSAQDWEFHIRCFLNQPKFDYYPAVFLHSRKLDNSLSSDFVKVSNNACTVIESFKKDFIERKVFENQDVLEKIIMTYFISYVYSGEATYKNEGLFWHAYSKGRPVFKGINQQFIRVFGFNAFLRSKRFVHSLRGKK
ncbi:hypothetical protein DNU06_00270 [Putridiphycobacter roseus]|uniref:Glycosyltransferase 2-like domain-containing protein n=1 Tax=Putridiphycobacter roseus TaxID=2219161 RepID=A0A2W1NFP8_9FLAO|nr:glycosyltransferase [Putridiphycobacter roseus]PZE18305.1 hypothetical protein DNU06_00270 [Putridiphycobacter roseus]